MDGILDMMASDSFMEEESLEPVGPVDVEIEIEFVDFHVES